ncbi:MAG: Ig-like domain-containing protein, partial [Verrucomicrobiota bacterium]
DKAFDGSTLATVTRRELDGVVAGDTVSLGVAEARFADALLGAGKPLSAIDPVLQGSSAANYRLGEVTVSPAAILNNPPVIDPFPRLTVVESRTLQEQLVARDGDLPRQTLVFRLLQGPTGVSLTTGGLLQWALRRTDIPGTYQVEVEVSDGVTNARRAGVITVTPSGIDPVVLPVADASAVENTVSGAVLTSPDPDLEGALSWSLVQGPQGFAVAADGRWSWQPGESLGGTRWTIVAEATDGRIRSRVSFRVDVVEDNQPPVWLATPPPVLTEGRESVWTVGARDMDEPVQALAYRLVSGPAGLTVTALGEMRWTPTEAQGPSESALEVAVGDGQVSVTNRFVVRVLEANQAPVWTGPTQFVVDEGTLLESRLLAGDPDLPAQPLTYAVAAGPEGLGVSVEGLLRWRPTEAQGPSTNLVRVTVGDGVETVARDLTVVVREVNEAPVMAEVADVTIEPLKPWTIRLPASDADLPAQRLVFARVQGPSGLTVGEDGVVAWTPTAAQGATTNRVEVSVGDGVAVVTTAFTVTVRPSNLRPVIADVPLR